MLKIRLLPWHWHMLLLLTVAGGVAKGLLGQPGRYLLLIPDATFLALAATAMLSTRKRTRFEWLLCVYVIYVWIRVLDPNVDTIEGVVQGIRKSSFFFVAILCGLFFQSVRSSSLIKLAIALGLAMTLVGWKQHYFWGPFDQNLVDAAAAGTDTFLFAGRQRAIGLFSSPFTLGTLGALLCVISVLPSRLRWLTLVMGVMILYLAMTRTNMIAGSLALVIAAFAASSTPALRKFIAFLLIGVLVLLGWIGYGSFGEYSELFDTRLLNRLASLDGAQRAFIAEPFRILIGFGTGSAGDALGEQFFMGYHITSHNLLLKVLFEGGVVGLTLFLIVGWRLWVGAVNLMGLQGGLCMGLLVVIAVNGLVGSAIEVYPVNILIGLLVGALLRAEGMGKEGARDGA